MINKITPILVVLFSVFITNSLYAQLTSNPDSLLFELRRVSGEEQVLILHKLSDQFERTHVDSSIHFAQRALATSKELDQAYLEAESHRKLGRILGLNAQNAIALEHLSKAEESFINLGDRRKQALTLENLGAFYKNQSNYEEALNYYFRALDIRERLSDQYDIQNTLLNIGILYKRLKQPDKSIDFYKRSLKRSEENDDANVSTITGVELADLLASTGDNDEAIRYMKKAYESSKQLPGHHAEASVLLELSRLYQNKESMDLALDANKQASSLADSFKNKTLKVLALQNIASIYEDMNDFDKAQQQLWRALSLLEERNASASLVIDIKNKLAANYVDLENYQSAIEEAEDTYLRAMEAGAFDLGLQSLNILKQVYKLTDTPSKGLEIQKKITALKDSIYQVEQTRQIAEMQTRYETRQKEKEIALLQKEKEQEALLRNAFLAGLILIGIIGVLVYNRQRLKIKKNKTELENTRLKEQKLEQDLRFKNKQLTTHTLHLVQKNGMMKDLKEKVDGLLPTSDSDINKSLRKLEQMVDYSFNLDDDWEQFRLYFEEVHTDFFEALKNEFPELTTNELRLAALAKLNLSIKEMAAIMGITSNSVKTARYRLRKKLDLETEENLTEFLMTIENTAQ